MPPNDPELPSILQRAVENGPMAAVVVRERKFEWVNQRFAELLGLNLESIVGQSTRLIYATDSSYEDFGQKAYSDLARDGRCENIVQIRRGDGSLLWARFLGSVQERSDVRAAPSFWLCEDVAEKKEIREEIPRAGGTA